MDEHSITTDSVIPTGACESMIRMLLVPAGWLKYKCGKLIRNTSLGNHDNGYTLHFHTEGRLRPWKKRIWLESHTGGNSYRLTREQAIYVMSNRPETAEIALYWLILTYPDFTKDD